MHARTHLQDDLVELLHARVRVRDLLLLGRPFVQVLPHILHVGDEVGQLGGALDQPGWGGQGGGEAGV